ncbi:hypothetical protein TNCV_4466401 [Trichonephila clavipes]|nr:hypothetical protein TNCV_4466401 [Trichonephila clavipes]
MSETVMAVLKGDLIPLIPGISRLTVSRKELEAPSGFSNYSLIQFKTREKRKVFLVTYKLGRKVKEKGRKPWVWSGPPTSLPLPPTTREDLRHDGYLETSMRKRHYAFTNTHSSLGFEPSPDGIAVSDTNHYTGRRLKMI